MIKYSVTDVLHTIAALEIGKSGPVTMLLKERIGRMLEQFIGPVEMSSYPFLNVARKHAVPYELVLSWAEGLDRHVVKKFEEKHREAVADTVVAWRQEKERRRAVQYLKHGEKYGYQGVTVQTVHLRAAGGDESSVGRSVDDN